MVLPPRCYVGWAINIISEGWAFGSFFFLEFTPLYRLYLSEMEEINGEVFQNVVIFYRFAGKIERMAVAKVILVILDLNELSKKVRYESVK